MSENVSEPVNRFTQSDWVCSEVLNIIAALAVIWIYVNLVLHGARTDKYRKLTKRIFRESSVTIYASATIAYSFALVRFVSNQVAFNVGYDPGSDLACTISLMTSVCSYAVVLVSTYWYLWLRQRLFYKDEALVHIKNKRCMTILNWATIIWLVSGIPSLGILYLSLQEFTASSKGCIDKSTNGVWPLYIVNGFTMPGQALMFFFFFYPLHFHFHGRNGKRVLRLIKRSAFLVSLTIFSDFAAALYAGLTSSHTSARYITLLMYDISMVVNLSSIIFSFENSREILSCVLERKKKAPRKEIGAATINGHTEEL